MQSPADIFMDVMREARIKRGITLEQLSERTGIPAHALRHWEAGDHRPRLASAFKIASALGYRFELVAAK